MDLSIVASMYHSESYLTAFYERIIHVADEVTQDYEIIFVNDGSPDNSLDVALSLQKKDPRVVVIDLSMNFGHHKAMMTGLDHAKGELVFLIDCDLEEQPEWLEKFYKEFRASEADVIYGMQAQRQGGFWERLTGDIYWWAFNFLSSHKIPANMLSARLMTRRYVRELVKHKENELDISGIWQITGFVQLPVDVNKNSKKTSTYTLKRKLILTARSITGFSNKPLIYIAVLGLIVLMISFLYFLYIMSVYLFVGKPPSGFTSTILSIWFLGGVILFSIGIIAIYLSVIFIETKNRPYTIIRKIYSRTANKSDHLLDPVKDFFTSKFEKIGARAEGVDYNSENAQIIRFEQFERLFGKKREFSLNDYGCGYGALAEYLKHKDYQFEYHGYDISAKMIDYANQSSSKNENWKFTSNVDELCSADFTIACGVFNLKFDADPKIWIDYIHDNISSIASISKLGFGFNMLTKYSDADKMRSDLYYGDPLYFFDYCKRQFSRNVALLHDYELYDFTILVRL